MTFGQSQYPNVDQSLSTWKPYECCKENLNKFHANNILKKGKIDLQEMIDWPNEAPREQSHNYGK
jgi:hypothetical protein